MERGAGGTWGVRIMSLVWETFTGPVQAWYPLTSNGCRSSPATIHEPWRVDEIIHRPKCATASVQKSFSADERNHWPPFLSFACVILAALVGMG